MPVENETIELDPDQKKQVKKLRKKLRNEIVKKNTEKSEPYAD